MMQASINKFEAIPKAIGDASAFDEHPEFDGTIDLAATEKTVPFGTGHCLRWSCIIDADAAGDVELYIRADSNHDWALWATYTFAGAGQQTEAFDNPTGQFYFKNKDVTDNVRVRVRGLVHLAN